MKKFIAFLFAFIFGGLISFAVFNNNMFLVLMLFQNKQTAETHLIEELSTFQYRSYFDLTLIEGYFDNQEDSEMEKTTHLLMVKDEETDTYSFIADLTITERDGDVEETKVYTIYYMDDVVYVNNKTDEEKTKESTDFDGAISYPTNNANLLFIEPFLIENEFGEDFVSKIVPTYSTNPFFVGVKLQLINDNDTYDLTYEFTFDFLGNYRGVKLGVAYDDGIAAEYVQFVVNNANEKPITLDFPSDLATDTDYVI